MSRFFFNVIDGVSAPDDEGIDLPDLHAARAEGVRGAGEMLRELAGDLSEGEWRVDVADETGAVVFRRRVTAEVITS